MSMALQDVVVVGAGMAGLICARRLQEVGYQVCVLEKSRGLGGRLATRRFDGVPMDHGARFLQPQGEMLRSLTQHLVQQNVLQPWQPHVYALDSTGQLNPAPSSAAYYIAPAGMSAVGKALAGDLTVHRQQRAIALTPTSAHTWQITAEQVDNGEQVQYQAKVLVLAMPAPQIAPLLEPLHAHSQIAAALEAIAIVAYAPCITVMAQYQPPISSSSSPLPCSPSEPWMVAGHADSPFFWVGLDSSKRAAETVNVVLQSSAHFAEHWLDAQNLQPAGEALLAQAGKLIAPWLQSPVCWQVHRWRYAYVERSTMLGLIKSLTPAPLVGCGDWCGMDNLDTALEAGWAAAAEVKRCLKLAALRNFLTDPTE